MSTTLKHLGTFIGGTIVGISIVYVYIKRIHSHDNDLLCKNLKMMGLYNKWCFMEIQKWCKNNFNNNKYYGINTNIPFKSVRNTLCHLWMADQVWLSRMLNKYEMKYTTNIDGTLKTKSINIHEMATYWTTGHKNDGQFELFLNELNINELFDIILQSCDTWINIIDKLKDDNDAVSIFEYKHRSGKIYKQQKNKVLTHVFNHCTHHRGQISGALTQLISNTKPINLDLVYYQRLHS